MSRYVVLSATTVDELQHLVNDALRQSIVKLIGGVAVSVDQYGNPRLFCQAVLYP